jgi:hypothetical protein
MWRRRFVIWAAIVAAAYLVVGVPSYLLILNSAAFRASSDYARTNPAVIQSIGTVQTVRLAPYNFAFRFRNNSYYARTTLWLYGDRSQGTLSLQLTSDSGPWQVMTADLRLANGKSLTLYRDREKLREW